MKRDLIFPKVQKVLAVWGFITLIIFLFVLVTQFRALGTLGMVVGLIESKSFAHINLNQFLNGSTVGIVASLKDPYSQYLDPKTRQELNERMSGEFGGIGVYVLQDEAGRMRLISPIEGTPAYNAGIKHEDIILQIGDGSIMNMNQDDVVSLLRGEPGTQVKILVYREAEKKELEFTIIREIISVPSVKTDVLPEYSEIGYVRLNIFQSHSHQELQEKINELIEKKHVKKLILDVRDNGGGDLEASLGIASLFLENQDIVTVADADGNKTIHKAKNAVFKIPLVLLVNHNSASASEILAGALQDNNRAKLVGEKTYGKGVVQTVYLLPDGGALKLTTSRYYTPNGFDINDIGINPDYVVANANGINRDMQLEKAIEILR